MRCVAISNIHTVLSLRCNLFHFICALFVDINGVCYEAIGLITILAGECPTVLLTSVGRNMSGGIV